MDALREMDSPLLWQLAYRQRFTVYDNSEAKNNLILQGYESWVFRNF